MGLILNLCNISLLLADGQVDFDDFLAMMKKK